MNRLIDTTRSLGSLLLSNCDENWCYRCIAVAYAGFVFGQFCVQLKHIRSMMGLLVFTGTTMLVKHIDAVTLDERISLGKFDRYNDHWAAGRR